MAITTTQKWRMLLAWLRRNFPAKHTIVVRSKPLKEYHGYTECRGVWFYIKINRKQCFALRIDTLIHEWAHCLVWRGAEADEDHSAEWGIQYAKIYRTFLEWNWGKGPDEEG